MLKELILLDKKRAFSKLPSIIRNDDLCYLLSKDYTSYLGLNKIVDDGCEVLNLSGRFNGEVEKLQNGYFNIFADLSKKHNSLEWWGTHLASRNSASIPLQLNITYLFCAEKIINDFTNCQNRKRLIFIADSQALLNSIALLGEQKSLKIFQSGKKIKKIIFYFKLFFLYIRRICLFAWTNFKNRKLVFSIFKPISFDDSLNKKKIVIRSWITKGTLNDDFIFTDRNFGILPDWLKSKGYEVIIFPMFFNLNGSLKDLLLHLKKYNFHFIFQDRYLKIIDYIRAIIMGWKQINIPLKNITLKATELTLLFQEIQLQQFTQKGREIYKTLQQDLESQYWGKIVAIDVETGDYFLGDSNNV